MIAATSFKGGPGYGLRYLIVLIAVVLLPLAAAAEDQIRHQGCE